MKNKTFIRVWKLFEKKSILFNPIQIQIHGSKYIEHPIYI